MQKCLFRVCIIAKNLLIRVFFSDNLCNLINPYLFVNFESSSYIANFVVSQGFNFGSLQFNFFIKEITTDIGQFLKQFTVCKYREVKNRVFLRTHSE